MISHNKLNVRKKILGLFFLTACLQNIEIVSFGTNAIKLYHVMGILLFPILLNKRRLSIPPKVVCFFGLLVILISFISYGVDIVYSDVKL